MKKTIPVILALICALILFASCNVTPASFYIKMGDMTYGRGEDKVNVEVTCDISSVNVRGLKCWWTFDGTEPTKDSPNTNVKDDIDDYDYAFDMVIPSDFYEGKIKLLCEIEYSERGRRKTAQKRSVKEFSTKYHSISWPAGISPLYKGKGYQQEYYTKTIPDSDIITYDIKEDGILKIEFLQGSGYFRVDNEYIAADSKSFSKEVKEGHSVDVKYYSDVVATTSAASGTKSAEYLISLE